MAYTPNNPYIPGDPYSYDLKWIVSQLKTINSSIAGIDEKIQAAVIAALDQHDPVYYATAAELIASGQQAGSIAYIEGYNAAGDGGANLYYVTDDYNDIVSAAFYLTMNGANKWALPIILTPYVTPEMFGAVGDGTTDDTNAIQTALNMAAVICFSPKTYMVSPVSTIYQQEYCIQIPANKIIKGNHANIQITANALNRYVIFNTLNNNHITIDDVNFIGDKNDHDYSDGNTHEWGYGLRINSDFINVNNCSFYNLTGDGFIIAAGNYIDIANCISHDNRRQGASITGGDNINITGSRFYNIDSDLTAGPCAGIDIEPDSGGNIGSINIDNCDFYDSRKGLLIQLFTDSINGATININNCRIGKNCTRKLEIYNPKAVNTSIVCKNSDIYGTIYASNIDINSFIDIRSCIIKASVNTIVYLGQTAAIEAGGTNVNITIKATHFGSFTGQLPFAKGYTGALIDNSCSIVINSSATPPASVQLNNDVLNAIVHYNSDYNTAAASWRCGAAVHDRYIFTAATNLLLSNFIKPGIIFTVINNYTAPAYVTASNQQFTIASNSTAVFITTGNNNAAQIA